MIWVPTHELVGKILASSRMCGIVSGDWDLKNRVLLADTDKHKSIYQHFVDGVPWEETDVFTNSYTERFRPHKSAQGRADFNLMLRRYRSVVEVVFHSLKKSGFKTSKRLPHVLIGRSGEVMLGNQGNHRVAMCKILGIEKVPCEVIVRHSAWNRLRTNGGAESHPDRLIAK